jgi:uncharacterized membrane protein YgdD (TMEM256/DUF423 family)
VVRLWLAAGGIFGFLTVAGGAFGAHAVTQIRWFGPITPLGGLSLLVGWAALVIAAARWGT